MPRVIQHYLPRTMPFLSTPTLVRLAICIAAVALVTPSALSGQTAASPATGKGAIVVMDRATLHQHFRALGYRTRGESGGRWLRATILWFEPSPIFLRHSR